MPTLRLISFHPDAPRKAASLKRRGLTIDAAPLPRLTGCVTKVAALNPSLLIFDLDKLPSSSRMIALALRRSKSARHIPFLFAGGLPEKISLIRDEFPTDAFSSWSSAPAAIDSLLKQPPPIHPSKPHRDFYTTPLPKKLGIASGMQVALIAAPDAFADLLGDLPPGAVLSTRLAPSTQLALCFIRSLADLARTLDLLSLRLPPQAHVWIIRPKPSPTQHVDFKENDVREIALASNLVDYKICSIDSQWSAIKFAPRKSSR
jgi:hypothetical protein